MRASALATFIAWQNRDEKYGDWSYREKCHGDRLHAVHDGAAFVKPSKLAIRRVHHTSCANPKAGNDASDRSKNQ
jgi:hypothetical protein